MIISCLKKILYKKMKPNLNFLKNPHIYNKTKEWKKQIYTDYIPQEMKK